jgi:MoaA/NifB/PqqE/SkfB family radical SAM enzyme
MNFKIIMIELCNTCNYHCMFCRTERNDQSKILRLKDFPDFERFIEMSEIINITGYGEVTFHPDFKEIIEILNKHNKKIDLITNGSLLTKDKIEILKKSNLNTLNISLNSIDHENYKLLSGGGNLDTVLNNLENVFKMTNIHYLQCSFVITNINFKEIKNIIDFGVKHNINISLIDLVPELKNFYDKNLILEDNQENRDYLNECNEYAMRKLGNKYHTFDFKNRTKENGGMDNDEERLKETITGCDYIDRIVSIGYTGEVFPCCWSHTILGNVKENSLENILNGKIYTDLKENVKIGSKKYCSNCRRLG